MAHCIRDIREDLGVPGLPFVIAETYYLIGEAMGQAMKRLLALDPAARTPAR